MGDDLFTLHHGDCLDVLRTLPDASVDAVVTDPPYGLSFMGKAWDHAVPGVAVWRECLRVLKPGGHLLAFAGTRTQHRMACAIEDAGFEIRDMIAWVYGCLDEATEVATEKGVMPYHKTKIGDRVLCYDVEHGEYTYQPILEIVEYDYSDTAFRLVGDFGEQIVSRNHRVIVERGGNEAFQIAETLECEARVPVLESLPALRKALHDAYQGAGRPQQDVQCDLCECVDRRSECGGDAAGTTQGCDDQVRSLRGECVEAECVVAQGGDPDMQQAVQRCASRRGVGHARVQRAGELVCRVGGGVEDAHDGRIQSGLEGWADISESQGCACGSADQVCALSSADAVDGAVGWLRDGASLGCCDGDQPTSDEIGVCSPHQSRCDGQQAGEPDVVCDQRAAQGVRAWGGHKTAVARVVPFHYTGKVWCLRVPTGAFVAVRNGVAFPTGNSGFPKSLDVSKAIDKAAGAAGAAGAERDTPATPEAQAWQGWGTALKPALEPITVARKPLCGTVAANVARHGAGALNIDGCRVGSEERSNPAAGNAPGGVSLNLSACGMPARAPRACSGRWPANLVHDGSEEAMRGFPETRARGNAGPSVTDAECVNCYNGGWGARDCGARFPSDSGSAARFFYCAKASKGDREEGLEGLEGLEAGSYNMRTDAHASRTGNTTAKRANNHPTVKPTDLMRWLVRLVTPPGGVVLDPFMGSGSTGKAAMLEKCRFIGVELDADYLEIARRRIEHAARAAKATMF